MFYLDVTGWLGKLGFDELTKGCGYREVVWLNGRHMRATSFLHRLARADFDSQRY